VDGNGFAAEIDALFFNIVGSRGAVYLAGMIVSPGLRRGLAATIVCVFLYGVAGFFILPPIVRVQAEKRLSAELGRTVSIGKVRINPFMLSLTLQDFEIRERDGRGSFLGWSRLYVRFDALRSLVGDWVLGDIKLDGFHAGVLVNPDGSFNFSDVLARFTSAPATAQAKPGRPVRISKLSATGVSVNFSDRSLRHPFSTVVGPLTFALSDFRAVGRHGAPYHFEAETEASERLEWNGTLSADPFASRGDFVVENIVLKKYTPYLETRIGADLTDGKLTLRGRYEVDLDPKGRLLTLSDSELHLRDLKVVERSTGGAAFELGALDVTGIQADAVASRASVGRVALAGGHVAVRRNKDGSVNLLGLLGPGTAPAAPPAASAPAGTPEVTVGEIALKDFWIDVSDEAVAHRAKLSLGGLQVLLKGFTLADGAAMPVQLSFDWVPKGTVQVDGTLTLRPAIKADLKANVAAFAILPLSPYLEEFVNARITQGAVSTSCSLRASMASGGPDVALEGDIGVERFGLVDAAHNNELAGFSRLALTGLRLGNAPQLAASVRQVDVVGPYVRVRVNADKSLNISSLVRSTGSPPPGHPAGAAAAAPAPRIEIGRVAISGGNFSFSDQSVEPNVQMSLGDFGGTISGLSSENLARADVGLKGMVGGAGPVEITGKLDPLGAHRFVGLKVDVRNVDLVPLSPYMGKYAGYELARGQLVVDSKLVVDGENVDATNVVTLNQFTFGADTASPDATALPVRLGVALLKDLDGKIVIDLPVQGSLSDPNFRIGKVVLRVVVNLLTKAAVSPFSLIGSMFGGGGEELAFQEFAPGSSELQPSELPKLETLAKALANRPALNLGLEGGYDTAADTYALKRSKLAELVRRQIWEERHAADPNIPPPDKLAISPEENAAMVKRLFDSKFPPGTQFGTPLPGPPAVKGPPPGPPPGLFMRIVYTVTFKRQREEAAAKKQSEAFAAQHEKDVAKAVAAGLPLEEMTGRLAESMEVTSNDLRALAAERAQRVRNRLVDSNHIAAGRLFLAQSTEPSKQEKGPRVFLTLE
jgi:hypothetical protein